MAEQSSAAEVERDRQYRRDPGPQRRRRAKRPAPEANENDGDEGGDESDARPELSLEKVRELIMTQLTVGVEVAGAALGLGRNSSYKACETGEITSFKIGGKVVVPTAPLRQKLGLEPPLPGGAPAPQIAVKQELIKSPINPPKRRRK